jgi:hypothetical protein
MTLTLSSHQTALSHKSLKRKDNEEDRKCKISGKKRSTSQKLFSETNHNHSKQEESRKRNMRPTTTKKQRKKTKRTKDANEGERKGRGIKG